MLNKAIPRLVIQLRSMIPDAKIELLANSATQVALGFAHAARPEWCVISETMPIIPTNSVYTSQSRWPSSHLLNRDLITRDLLANSEQERNQAACLRSKRSQSLQFLSSSLRLEFPQLEGLGHDELLRLLSCENAGLRGLTLGTAPESPTLLVRTGFVAQLGRTVDETENLAIDVMSLLRFARLLEDRIMRSSIDGKFSFEMYYSQFISVGSGRNRYIRYARSIFQGSADQVIIQLQSLLKNHYAAQTNFVSNGILKVQLPDQHEQARQLGFALRVTDDIPMLTCDSPMLIHRTGNCGGNGGGNGGPIGMTVLSALQMMELAADLNARPTVMCKPGHFEVSADGAFLT